MGESPHRRDEQGQEPGQERPSGREEVGKAKRRHFIASAAAVTFGAELDEPVEQILATADEPKVPTRVRSGDVADLRQTWETLRRESGRGGGAPVRHQWVGALRWAVTLRKSSSTPAVRRKLAVMTAKLADSASWYLFDAGQHSVARELSLIGLSAARESGDPGIGSWVAAGLARQEVQVGNWADGLELVQLGFTAGDALAPNAVADLYLTKALAHARKHDPVQCQRYLDAATHHYRPETVADGPFWLISLPPFVFERDVGCARYDLVTGEVEVAGEVSAQRLALIEELSTGFRQYPAEWVRSRANIAARLATLLYLEGEQRMAQQTVEETIVLAGQVRSARLANDLRGLLRAMPPADRCDEHSRELRHRVGAVLIEMT